MRKHRAQSFGALNAFEVPDRRSKGRHEGTGCKVPLKVRKARQSWGEDSPQRPWKGLSVLRAAATPRCKSKDSGLRPSSPAIALSSSATPGVGLASLTVRLPACQTGGSSTEEGGVGTPGSIVSINSTGESVKGGDE